MRRLILGLLVALPAAAFALPGEKWAQADPAMRDWFEKLKAPRSPIPCCSDADGETVQQDIRLGADGKSHWFVYVDGAWREVGDDAVVPGPNLIGRPMVWVTRPPSFTGRPVSIRCFLPGALG